MSVMPTSGARRSSAIASADTLQTLADRVARLAPSHRDPHAFHEAKSEIVDELRRLAAERARHG